jgi:DNA-binding IclR family transcriptional regulator
VGSPDAEPSDLIRSVSRALRIMEEVSRSPRPLPVKVIARRCQLHLSTAYHLVRTLRYEGYLERRPGGGYVAARTGHRYLAGCAACSRAGPAAAAGTVSRTRCCSSSMPRSRVVNDSAVMPLRLPSPGQAA